MSVHLVGGSVEPGHGRGLLAPFLAEVRSRAGDRTPRLAVLLVDRDGSLDRFLPDYVAALGDGLDVRAVGLAADRPHPGDVVAAVAEADGIVVGGGPTPEYHAALTARDGLGDAVHRAVRTGTPYAGFSAGAMVAGETALLGGYLSHGHEVCEDGCSEGLDPLTVRPGLGLVPFTCDVHITAAGTLGRALELVTAGLVETAVGIDEDTCLTAPPGGRAEHGTVAGAGSVWLVRAGDTGEAVVRRVGG